MSDETTSDEVRSACRLCGCHLRAGDALVRVGDELLHASCAAPLAGDSAMRRAHDVGALNQLVAGIGRATVV